MVPAHSQGIPLRHPMHVSVITVIRWLFQSLRMYNIFSVIVDGRDVVLEKENQEFGPMQVNMHYEIRRWMGVQWYFPNLVYR